MNKISPHLVAQIRSYVRSGASLRRIAGRTGVNKGTVHRYVMQFRHEAPKCPHDKSIYRCPSCASKRRVAEPGRDILWVKSGPRKEIGEETISAEMVLKWALLQILDEVPHV